ncbi:TssQ family T6SS-associated lipoprotein [Aquabacterium sp.]|uniref:TssQ family T6SS-associated lipoprotein n=1 Tax=Aquabacterium sp. TaxID=1872578 RepID=UPI0025B7BF01|nr:TssQ family T6SS-associated lipoprotein [Aquabacterium sp.]
MKSTSVPRKGWEKSTVLSSWAVLVAVGMLSACSSMKHKEADQSAAVSAAPPVVVAPAPVVVEEPALKKPTAAEMSLADGVKAYQGGQYRMAETQLKTALQAGLTAPADVANAHKHLAFIYCTSKRDTPCLAAFKAAKAADPSFALSKAEAGHPMWAKTYKKALGLK